MSITPTNVLAQLDNASVHASLRELTRGLEKESLRVLTNGHLSQERHPHCLGSTLTHPSITTDYSEALLEFITPPYIPVDGPLQHLDDYHRFFYHCEPNEKLWVSSMPCVMQDELSIPIAEYGLSNSGRMKHVYRHGLWHRYGRTMQTIAGVHYNFSFPQSFWQLYQAECKNTLPLQTFISDRYFHIIRNFQRYVGMIVYLFGASPAVCTSFLQGQPHNLDSLGDHTLYAPYGTSLRMSNLGYNNDAQSGLKISYNSLNEYVTTLSHAIRTPYQPYLDMGVLVDGNYKQLNGNILQIENEYYGNIRPKRTAKRGERPTVALARAGVEYIEMRCVDLDPYEPLGISAEQIRVLDTFALFCLLQDGGPITDAEQKCITFNNEAMVMRGRDPELRLKCNNDSVNFHAWSRNVLDKMRDIASLLDSAHNTNDYTVAVTKQIDKVNDPQLTPSARILQHLNDHQQSFYEFSMEMAQKHEHHFRQRPLDSTRLNELKAIAKHSWQEHHALEDNDNLSFDAYLARYFAD